VTTCPHFLQSALHKGLAIGRNWSSTDGRSWAPGVL
jgi:hypothetical protein